MNPSETVEWATPKDLFDKLNAIHNFTLDVAASSNNALCDEWFGLDHVNESRRDGLAAQWYGRVWCNPPYGRVIKYWVKKAQQHNDLVVMLLPSRTDTKWFHELVLPYAEVQFIKGRLKFGESKLGAPFPSIIVTYSQPVDK